VPGIIDVPKPAQDLGAQYPNLGRTNAALSSDILAGLNGQLSPGTLRDLQDFNAAQAVGGGMPGSGLFRNRLGRNIGLSAEALKNQAISQYNSTVPTISGTQTVNPALQTSISESNAINSSAPDPTAAASHAEQLYQRYLQGLSNPGGGINRAGGGGQPWWATNASSGPAAADSMGEVVARGPAGGTVSTGGGAPGFEGGYSGNDILDYYGLSQGDATDMGLTPEDLAMF
jgi:hypothetical protein